MAPDARRLLCATDSHKPSDSGLVGESEGLRRVLDAVEMLAALPSDVLIVGEPGSGTRTVARAIHQASGAAVIVPIRNSGITPIPAGLTDGTLIVEDLVAIGAEAQAELLRYADRAAPRLRLVATLPMPPGRATREGWLRRDLLQRLEGQTVEVPPLRERKDDIPALVEHLLHSFCHRRCGCIFGASRAAVEVLMAYDWPGNVRELRDVVNHAVTRGTSGWIEPADLPPPLGPEGAAPADGELPRFPTLAEAEATLIRMALERAEGNKSLAARLLGISRHKLYDRLRSLGQVSLQPPE